MLMGHADGLLKAGSKKHEPLNDYVSGVDEDDDEELGTQILYVASFEELAGKHMQYDTVIWASISLLLVLAWGIGIIMLLYLPYRRYVLQKDISLRRLYVTSTEIVYKLSRPSYIPFWGVIRIERHMPLSSVIDIILEQGCLQAMYGMHTFRIENIAHGKAAPVDELRIQGVSNPRHLRKVIIEEASKIKLDVATRWNATSEGESMFHMTSLGKGAATSRQQSTSSKMTGSPHHASVGRRGLLLKDLVLRKLEAVSKSLKRIESLMEKEESPC